jgi:hypothetical protein
MHHVKSEKYASLAEAASKEGEFERATELYRLAAEQELFALADLDKSKRRTLGITVVSAAALWYKARDSRVAQNVAKQWLDTELLPAFAINQLHNLMQAISNELAPAKPGIESTDAVAMVPTSEPEWIKIMCVAANPFEVTSLQLDEEVRTIHERMRDAPARTRFDISKHGAVRIADLQGLLLQHRPTIVHFSGHGSKASEIVLQDNSGNPTSARALGHLFASFKDSIRCVVLNACYSQQQARAIAGQIESVVGMPKGIGHAAAIEFAASFYQALGFGRNIHTAFDLASSQIGFTRIRPESLPQLLARNTNPEGIVFAGEDKLTRHLVEGNELERLAAAQALVRISQKTLTSLLIERSIADPNPTVRYWINVALGKVGSAEAIEALRRNVKDPNPFALLGVHYALKELGEVVDTVGRKPPPMIDFKGFQGVSQHHYASAIIAQGARDSNFPDPNLSEKIDALDHVRVHWKTVRREANGDVIFMASILATNGWINIWTRCGISKGMDIVGERKEQTLEELLQHALAEVRCEQGERAEHEEFPVFETITLDVLAAYDKDPKTLANINISG